MNWVNGILDELRWVCLIHLHPWKIDCAFRASRGACVKLVLREKRFD